MQNWKTLTIYIARQFLLWCFVVFLTMATIVFLLDYVELIRRSGSHQDATLVVLLEMAALKQPYMWQQFMPFAILFGTMLTFWRMTRSNELVVVRSAGISAWQFLSPIVACALVIGIAVVTVFNPIASTMQTKYQKLESRVLRSGNDELALTRSGLWLRQSDERGLPSVIHAESLASGGTVLEGVLILFFDNNDRVTSRIDAKQAKLEDGHWLVTRGTRWQPRNGQEPFTELTVATNMTQGKIEQSFASPETISFWDLPSYIALLEQSGFPAQRHRLEYDALLARPFLLAAMVLVAAAFSLRMHRRGGTVLMIAAGVGSGFLLYLLSTFVFALGQSATIPVYLAAWTPPGVSWLMGSSLLFHLEDG